MIERVVEKTFPATANPSLKVDVFTGGIAIFTSDEPTIRILVRQTIDAKDDAEADKKTSELALSFQQTGDTLAFTCQFRRAARWAWEKWPPLGIGYEIHVPRHCTLDLTTREGGINIANLEGDVHATTYSGSIFIGEIDGNATAINWRGDIAVTACTRELKLETKSGNIMVGRAAGLTEITGVSGSIEVQRASGAIRASGDGADLKVGFTHPITATSELKVSGGDIILNLDPRSDCNLDARASSFGHVRIRELPLTFTSGQPDDSRLTATLNQGGPLITVRASGGNVRVNGIPDAP